MIIEIEQNSHYWHIPASIVARNYADFMLADYGNNDVNLDWQSEYDYIHEDKTVLLDWFTNHMTWEDVAAYAVLVDWPRPQYKPDLESGNFNIIVK